MRQLRLLLAISALIIAAGCGSDANPTTSIDARVFDARPAVDGPTTTVDAQVPTLDSGTGEGLDAPITDLDAPVTELDAPTDVVDAAPGIDAAPQPDSPPPVTLTDGDFLFAIAARTGNTPLGTLRAIATSTFDTSTSKVSLHIQYLTTTAKALITEDQAQLDNIAVNSSTGAFSVSIASLKIPASANTFQTELTVTNVVIAGTIQNPDFFCGSLDGTVLGMSLAGSTFGTVRVAHGTTGASLPPDVTACPVTKR